MAQTSRFQHLRLDTRDHIGVVVASGRKDPVGYEALFAIDPGMENIGVSFVIRDHLDPKNLRLEFAQQVEVNKDTRLAVIAFRLVASMDAWLKNWNRYKLRADVRNRLQRVIVVVEQQYFSPGGDMNLAMISFVHCLETAIIATRSQTEYEFKMIQVSPESVRKYCGLPKTKKHPVRKAQTKAFVERGLGLETKLERHDVADSIALAITALRQGDKGRVRLVPVEMMNTDFLFAPPEEVQVEDNTRDDELTDAGAKGFLHVDEEEATRTVGDGMGEPCSGCPDDEGIPNGDDGHDLEAGVQSSGSQPEEAGAALRPDAGPTCDGDDGRPHGVCGNADAFDAEFGGGDCRCDHCADDAEMPCIRDPIWKRNIHDDDDGRPCQCKLCDDFDDFDDDPSKYFKLF